MGCLGFIGEIFGINVVFRGWRSNKGLTLLLVVAVMAWGFFEGIQPTAYAHLGEHRYVFHILPLVSCASPLVAGLAILSFTVGDALTNVFSGAFQSSFGIQPPFDLYQFFGFSSPLLTWGAYVRLSLVGLMAYAILPGLLARTAGRMVMGMVRRLRPARPVHADGPPPTATDAAQDMAVTARDMVAGYLGAVAGAAAGTTLGGGVFYGQMWAEYFPLREVFHPSGQPDSACFKADAHHTVQNVKTGGTVVPAGGAVAVVSAGPAGARGAAPGATPGVLPPGATAPGTTNLEYGDKATAATSKAQEAELEYRKQQLADADAAAKRKYEAGDMGREEFEAGNKARETELEGIRQREKALGDLNNALNILYDYQNYRTKEGMSELEAGFNAIVGNLAGDAFSDAVGPIDFVAGIFFPQSMQGYVPSNAAKDGIKAVVNGVKAFGSALGGDEQALDRFGHSAKDGEQGKIAEGWANIADMLGGAVDDPMGSLRELNKGIGEIWEYAPEIISENAEKFAQECLDGKEGPMALAVAELAQGAGSIADDPVGGLKQIEGDLVQIVKEGEASELLFGEEGSDRAVQILGPIGEGYKEAAKLAGEAAGNPKQFAKDVKDVAVHVAEETGRAIKQTAGRVWNGIRSLGSWWRS